MIGPRQRARSTNRAVGPFRLPPTPRRGDGLGHGVEDYERLVALDVLDTAVAGGYEHAQNQRARGIGLRPFGPLVFTLKAAVQEARRSRASRVRGRVSKEPLRSVAPG